MERCVVNKQLREAYQSGQFEWAKQLAEAQMNQATADHNTIAIYAACCSELGESKLAIEFLLKSASYDSVAEVQRQFVIGQLLADLGEPARAKAHFHEALKLDPDQDEILARVGLLDMEEGHLGAAESIAKRLTAKKFQGEELQSLLLGLAIVHKKIVEVKALLDQSFVRSVHGEKEYTWYLRNAAYVSGVKLMNPQTILLPDRAATSVAQLKYVATIAINQRRYGDASTAISSARLRAPTDPWLSVCQARLERSQGQFSRALSILDEIIFLNPGFLPAIREKSLTLGEAGMKEESFECAKRAWEISPGRTDMFRILFEYEMNKIDLLGILLGRKPDWGRLRSVLALTRRYKRLKAGIDVF